MTKSAKRRGASATSNDRPAPAPEASPAGRLSPFGVATAKTLALAALALAPHVRTSPPLVAAVLGAAAALVVLQTIVRLAVRREGRTLRYQIAPQPVHYVQATMQGCVYAYWGWYWPEVYEHVPLILAQVLFAYVVDMLVTWLRRDDWVLGAGPFPIVFSTNLFMWFRDDWFVLQFLMVATGVLGKEFIKWDREGKRTHIFNPSALSLFLFSTGLILTQQTEITWGPEIAATLGLPPKIYLEVFLVGLVVQVLFSVTLVTLAATFALFVLGFAYTGSTGSYHFIMTNLPIAVFLGLHLLVTDPATSPRTTLGKVAFGTLYGTLAFLLFGLFRRLDVPTFYDKLLPVPILNLTVQHLDRMARAISARFRLLEPVALVGAKRFNRYAVAVWVSLFVALTSTGFLGREHPGRNASFWRQACEEDRANGCITWVKFLEMSCGRDAEYCNVLGGVLQEGRKVPRDLLAAGKAYRAGCDSGSRRGCDHLRDLAVAEGATVFADACKDGDKESCFIHGELQANGFGTERDSHAAFETFKKLCDDGSARTCGRLADCYLEGEGTKTDPVRARQTLDRACAGGHAQSCVAAAQAYRTGTGGAADEAIATARLRHACELGLRPACPPGEDPPPRSAGNDSMTIELQKLGG